MPGTVISKKGRRRVQLPFKKHTVSASAARSSQAPKTTTTTSSSTARRRHYHDYSPNSSKAMASEQEQQRADVRSGVPSLFADRPPIRDSLVTETSLMQDETVGHCQPFLSGRSSSLHPPFNEFGLPHLYRDEHVGYLYDALEDYPAGFVALDASRPWMLYWALNALYILGEDVSQFRKRVISTIAPMQNTTGGFGGGHGQMSHCAPSYAALLSLALVGGEEAFKLVDRKSFWNWLGQLKQPDGGFQVSDGGEEDVRGAYCAMVMIVLLDLPLELPPDAKARRSGHNTFLSGLPEYLSRCQTFEGGISGSPGTEAHGAYAFCALACLCLLGHPSDMIHRYLDLPSLLSWLSSRQNAPEGGFSGRTNKLVDGCYSHWVGSCWPLVEAALNGDQPKSGTHQSPVGSLYSREGLTRYILCCCQSPRGGLRDKPGKHPDSYHTCYTLAGLSNTQHNHFTNSESPALPPRGPFTSAFSWDSTPSVADADLGVDRSVFDEGDRVKAIHPLFVIPHRAAETMRSWYEESLEPTFDTQ